MKNLFIIFFFAFLVLLGCKEDNIIQSDDLIPKDGEISIKNDHVSAPNATLYVNGVKYNSEANVNKGGLSIIFKNDSVYFFYNDGIDTLTKINKQNSAISFIKLLTNYYENKTFISKILKGELSDINFKTGIVAKQISNNLYEFSNPKARWAGVEVDNQPPFLMEGNEVIPEISVASTIGLTLDAIVKHNPQLNVNNSIKTFGSPFKAFIFIKESDYLNTLNSNLVSSFNIAKEKNPEFMKRVVEADVLSMTIYVARRIIKTLTFELGGCQDLLTEPIYTALEASAWQLVSSKSVSEFDQSRLQVLKSSKEIIASHVECAAQAACTGSTEGVCQFLGATAKAIQEIIINNTIFEINTMAGAYDAIFSLSYDEIFFNGFIDGLVAYYPFNNNANDESGNGNNGTVNGPTLTADRFGNSNHAFNFDGVSNYILVSGNNGLQFGTADVTVCAWIKTSPTNSSGRIINRGECNGSAGWQLTYDNGTNSIVVGLQHGGGATYFRCRKKVNDNIWHFLTWSRKNNFIKIFIDGVADGDSGAFNISLTNSSSSIKIGRGDSPCNYPFQGSIDDIRIYNRALSDTEIQTLYHECGW